jgi:hypothetical protein
MASNTVRRFDKSGLFGPSFNNSILCLSYDITQENIYGGDLNKDALSKLSLAVKNAYENLRVETHNAVLSRKELVTVKRIGGRYQVVSEDYYSSDNEHRLNVGLEIPGSFDLKYTVQDFLNHSKGFIERIGKKVSDNLFDDEDLPQRAIDNLRHYIRNYLGSS